MVLDVTGPRRLRCETEQQAFGQNMARSATTAILEALDAKEPSVI